MAIISDRTVIGTIQACKSGRIKPHIGLQGAQRFQRNKRRLQTFVGTLPEINIRSHLGTSAFYNRLAQGLERHFALQSESLEIVQLSSRTYRKTTFLSQINRFGTPWLILKAFSENRLGHESLRALRESDGSKVFGSILGVEVPKILAVFAITGPRLPLHSFVVAETILPGMPALNYLELAAGKVEKERDEALSRMQSAFEQSARMLADVHAMVKAKDEILIDLKQIFNEACELTKMLRNKGILSEIECTKVINALEKRYNKIHDSKVVLAHRDYASNNLLYYEKNDKIGIIDLEKSELEYPGKDLAKFTEAVFIDGKSIGLTDSEISRIQQAFLKAYLDLSKIKRSTFWSQLGFYQIYSSLSLARYQLKQENFEKIRNLRDRILDLS